MLLFFSKKKNIYSFLIMKYAVIHKGFRIKKME